jgi:hypothetical protein
MIKKSKSPAQMLRKIEILEAQIAELKQQLEKAHSGWGDICAEKILAQMRCEQALRILSGEDE